MDYQVKSGFSTDVFDWEEDVAPEIAKRIWSCTNFM